MPSPIRLAVVGAGKLGGYHANLAAQSDAFHLAAVVDPAESSAKALAKRCNATPALDVRSVLSGIDAAVVATPTSTHSAVVGELLDAGKHVLVEKPIAPTLAEADRMVNAADRAGVKLQVGHVERFNPALAAAGDAVRAPRYLRATRASGYTFRSTDIGVVLDLMVHDIDLALSLVDSEVTDVSAMGVAVMGGHEDLANARLTFANGCVADLTASRVSYEAQRSMQAVTQTGFVTLDFATGSATTVTPTEPLRTGAVDPNAFSVERKADLFAGKLFDELLVKETREAPAVNAIELELADFADAIRTGKSPRVPGTAGRDAVAVAERVLREIARAATPTVTRVAA